MTLVMVGANPRRAPFLPLSASLAGEGALGAVLTALAGHRSVAEALVLATGERFEVYVVVEDGVDSYDLVLGLLGSAANAGADLAAHGYFAEGADAAAHLFAAVAAIDEFAAADEDMAAAWCAGVAPARARGSFGPRLEALGDAARALAARLAAADGAETADALGATVAELARRVFDHLDRRQVLAVGDDGLVAAAVAALAQAGVGRFSFVGAAPAPHGAAQASPVVSAEALPVALGNADIVVAAPGAVPLLDKRAVRAAMRSRRGRAMLLVDVSAGHAAIDSRAASIDDAFLYTRDDLVRLTQDAPWSQAGRAAQRRAAVAEAVRDFSYQLA